MFIIPRNHLQAVQHHQQPPHNLQLVACRLSGAKYHSMTSTPGPRTSSCHHFDQGTQKQYDTYLKKWSIFSQSRGNNSCTPSANALIDFLYQLHKEGLKYSALNTARSAVSSLCLDAQSVGSQPLVKRFMRGMFNIKLSFPKHVTSWDPSQVLHHLKGTKAVADLDLKRLTLKFVMLIALLSAQRIQTLALLNIDHMVLDREKVSFKIPSLLKQSRPGHHLEDIVLTKYPWCRRLCIVTLLTEYIRRTESLRSSSQLFISYVEPYKVVTKATIARWLKTVLADSGVGKNYTPHSTRSASTSKAQFLNVPIDTIMRAAGWARTSTFATHYKKPIKQFGMFGKALLDAAMK